MSLFLLQPKIYGAWQPEELAIVQLRDIYKPKNPIKILDKEKEITKEEHRPKKAPK